MSRARVLIADDEPAVRYMLREIIEEEGLAVVEVDNGRAALDTIEQDPSIALVVSDLQMPVLSGLELLAALAARPSSPPLILVTAHGSERVAVEAMKLGAVDYFRKPLDADEIATVVRRHMGLVKLTSENQRLRAKLALSRTMVFESQAMQRVAELVERVSARDVTVLVVGETGTGKELIARAIVDASQRAQGPFVRFNCAALVRDLAEAELFGHSRGAFTGAVRDHDGHFVAAHGGTLFLDEIGDTSPAMQSKLLRALQEGEIRPVGSEKVRKVDVRVIAATNRDLEQLVTQGKFRQDLFYRLNVLQLWLPPLRERGDDIVLLARRILADAARRAGRTLRFSAAAEAVLLRARWPGNVRQLQNEAQRLAALADGPEVGPADLSPELRTG